MTIRSASIGAVNSTAVFKVADILVCHVLAAQLRKAAMASRTIVSGLWTLCAAAMPIPGSIGGTGSIAFAERATRINKEEKAIARSGDPNG
jgi:hypothetical protein